MYLAIFLVLFTIIPLAFAKGGGGGVSPPVEKCAEDTWTCGEWNNCGKDGTQTRSCQLTRDCPSVETPKPEEKASCVYVSKTLKSLQCYNQATLQERVQCRLGLSKSQLRKELAIDYLPEECRTVSTDADKEDCVLLYGKSQPCWDLANTKERMGCIKNMLNLTDIQQQKHACGTNNGCLRNIQKNVYALIKFSFYELEERAEALYEEKIIDQEKTASIVAQLEEQKIAFNNAKSKEERKQVIQDTKKIWKDFVESVRWNQ